MLARCGTFHHSMWLRDWDRNTILCSGTDISRRSAWYGNIPTCFFSNLFVHSFSECFWNIYCEPSIEAGTLRDAKEVDVIALAFVCWHLLFQSSECWLALGFSLSPLLFLIYTHYPANPIAINMVNKHPDNSQIFISSPNLQTHI